MSGWTLFVDELVLQGSGDLDDMVGRGKICDGSCMRGKRARRRNEHATLS